MPPSSEVLKHRFLKLYKKRSKCCYQSKMENMLIDFGTTFLHFFEKNETSHFSSQPLRARAMRGVSSNKTATRSEPIRSDAI